MTISHWRALYCSGIALFLVSLLLWLVWLAVRFDAPWTMAKLDDCAAWEVPPGSTPAQLENWATKHGFDLASWWTRDEVSEQNLEYYCRKCGVEPQAVTRVAYVIVPMDSEGWLFPQQCRPEFYFLFGADDSLLGHYLSPGYVSF